MLALIAGQGALPAIVAQAAQERPIVTALHGFTPDGLSVDLEFRIEQLGSFLSLPDPQSIQILKRSV